MDGGSLVFVRHGDWLIDDVMSCGIARVMSYHRAYVYSCWRNPRDEFERQWIGTRDSKDEAIKLCEKLVEDL